MKTSIFEKIVLLGLLAAFCFGCSFVESFKKQESDSTSATPQTADKSAETIAASPCENRYHPIKDGAVINYEFNNPMGKSAAKVVQRYSPGEATFTEEWTFDKTVMKQVWQCTPEGLVAPNYGSALTSSDTKVEPRHISGVTMPPEKELIVGKSWTAVYDSKAELPSGLGETVTRVTVNSKIVALDDEVKTTGGTFKAMKIEMIINTVTQYNGKTIPVPAIKSTAWFAPGVGMVKSGLTDSRFGNATVEYVSNN